MAYPLYAGVETLLAPESLSRILQRPVTDVRYHAWGEHEGLSASRFASIDIGPDGAERLVLKRMDPRTDWTMQASDDVHCRAVTLWTYGLLDRLLPEVDHAVVACSRDVDGWAILMRDVSTGLLPWGSLVTVQQLLHLLDAMAAMHAKFWQASELGTAALGLCDSENMLQMFSPLHVETLTDITTVHPKMLAQGWPILLESVAPDVRALLLELMRDPQPLAAALDSLPRTLVHGNLRFGNVALPAGEPPQPVFLDWQTAGYTVATVDLAWFLERMPVERSALSKEAAVAYYHERLTARLDSALDAATWAAMLDLGWLANILRWGCISAWTSRHADTDAHRAYERARLARMTEQVRAGMKWITG